MPTDNIWKTSRDPLTKLYGRPSLLSITDQPSPLVFIPNYSQGSVSHLCWSHSALGSCSMHFIISNQNGIMPINILSVINEIIVWSSGCGPSHWKMSIITGVSNGDISNALRRVRDISSLAQGLKWASVANVYKKRRSLPSSYHGEEQVSLCVHD